MKTTLNFDPESYIRIIQLLLMGLDDLLTPEDINEDVRSVELNRKLQNYRDKVARIKSAVAKHREAERRKQDLTKDNDRRNPKGAVSKTVG